MVQVKISSERGRMGLFHNSYIMFIFAKKRVGLTEALEYAKYATGFIDYILLPPPSNNYHVKC